MKIASDVKGSGKRKNIQEYKFVRRDKINEKQEHSR